jgi:glycosyltransferase involved in cell wall biosynthesis
MKVLIGVPSHRRPDGLRRLLRSLEAQEGLDGTDVEVFVADNDATGGEAITVCKELAPDFRWPLTCELVEERGISAARNAILDQARQKRADFVGMIDDDEVAEPNWLRELLMMQEGTGADVVGGPVVSIFEREPSATVRELNYLTRPARKPGPIAMIDGTGNVLISCASLSRIGWPSFDAAFGVTGGGDKEYFTRLRKSRLRFAWAPKAIAQEYVPASRANARWVLRRAFRVGNSDFRITRLHGTPADSLISFGKALFLLGTGPICLPVLLVPTRRLWLMAKWSRAAGKVAALFGSHYREYASPNIEAAH